MGYPAVRIVAATGEAVTFRYTDSATQESKECTLTAEEFMRRYLQHVPPPGQHRVRYFGWMHPAAKKCRMIVETLRRRRVGQQADPVRPATDFVPLGPKWLVADEPDDQPGRQGRRSKVQRARKKGR